MNEYLGFFLKTIGLEQEKIQEIIDNPELETIEEKVKASVLFILANNSKVNCEVEEKILDIDLDFIVKKLKKEKAKKIFDGTIEDNRYDFENTLFKNEHIILRTRKIKGKKIITFKKRLDNENSLCSMDLELEKEVLDMDSIILCFKKLKLNEIKGKKYIKYRVSYELDGVHFDFDKYEGIPLLLEIEAHSEEVVQEWKVKLGLENHRTVKYGYRRLKEEQEKKDKLK